MVKSKLDSLIRPLLAALFLLGGPVFSAPRKAPTTTIKRVAAGKLKPPPQPKAKLAVLAKPAPKPGEKPVAKPAPVLAPGELALVAQSAISVDLKSGAVLYEKDADSLQYPASATKILTALLIIESGKLEKLVTVDVEDTKVEPTMLEIKPGETYPRKDLLFALLMKSANDVAAALARDNAGSVPLFAGKMNQRAEQLGATSSHFVTPCGLHDLHHYTTARDLSLITAEAMKNPLFREIVATVEATILKADVPLKLRNHNRLLTRMPGCIGVKTGFTNAAQQVLVSAATREGREVLAIVLHTDKPGIWEDSMRLLYDGFEKLGLPPLPPVTLPLPSPVGPEEKEGGQ